MAEWIGIGRRARRCYGFDEVALVPGSQTVNPNEVDISWAIGDKKFEIPFLAAAMDGVVDVDFAVVMAKLGGIAVLNLDGVQTRYDNPSEVLSQIASASPEEATKLVQSVYLKPIKEDLIAKRIKEIKSHKVLAVVSCIPQNAKKFSTIAEKAGCDMFIVQSTVATVKHMSSEYKALDIQKFCEESKIPIIIGNCVTYEVALELMECGASALLVGIGPGAACTTRIVTGVGVPQLTAILECAKAAAKYKVPIIADGGIRNSGDFSKAFAAGASAVMIGSLLAGTDESPGEYIFEEGVGYKLYRGMASREAAPNAGDDMYRAPEGKSGKVPYRGRAKNVLDDLIAGLRSSMSYLGAKNLREFQKNAKFIKITQAALSESYPHGVK